MELLPNENDYACFIDGDACFTTHTYGKQIEDILKQYPDVDLWTAMTNRVATKWQMVRCVNTNDIEYHRKLGKALQEEKYDKVRDVTSKSPISGFFFVLKKKSWMKTKGFKKKGMLGVDNSIHYEMQRIGGKVYQMLGLYVYHWYRNGNRWDTKHLQK